jgi:hypothetical protein
MSNGPTSSSSNTKPVVNMFRCESSGCVYCGPINRCPEVDFQLQRNTTAKDGVGRSKRAWSVLYVRKVQLDSTAKDGGRRERERGLRRGAFGKGPAEDKVAGEGQSADRQVNGRTFLDECERMNKKLEVVERLKWKREQKETVKREREREREQKKERAVNRYDKRK